MHIDQKLSSMPVRRCPIAVSNGVCLIVMLATYAVVLSEFELNGTCKKFFNNGQKWING